eukprot:3317266-Lingulodinium_polyedra.AAC.1
MCLRIWVCGAPPWGQRRPRERPAARARVERSHRSTRGPFRQYVHQTRARRSSARFAWAGAAGPLRPPGA